MAKKRYDYFAEETTPDHSDMEVLDCNNSQLQPGDTIISIQWLKVKGWTDIKKWEKFTNISFTDDPIHVQARTKKNGKMMLKTEFFKKG
jgi:uncharacterized Zn ribbon protein